MRVRDWLHAESGTSAMRGGAAIYRRYVEFRHDLPDSCREAGLDQVHLTFVDFTNTISAWLRTHT